MSGKGAAFTIELHLANTGGRLKLVDSKKAELANAFDRGIEHPNAQPESQEPVCPVGMRKGRATQSGSRSV
jgi:hypothetical protein